MKFAVKFEMNVFEMCFETAIHIFTWVDLGKQDQACQGGWVGQKQPFSE